jgi:hypothetical protein
MGASAAGSVAKAEAAKQQKKAARAQRRAQQLQQQQQRLDMLRQHQRAEAGAIVTAQASGASLESSGAQGVQSSLDAQTGVNLRLQGVGVALGQDYYNRLRNASKLQGQAAMFGAAASIAGMASSFLPGKTAPPGATPTTAAATDFSSAAPTSYGFGSGPLASPQQFFGADAVNRFGT